MIRTKKLRGQISSPLSFRKYYSLLYEDYIYDVIRKGIDMITFCILAAIILVIAVIVFIVGGSIILIFLDPIICGLIIYGIYKLVKWIKHH